MPGDAEALRVYLELSRRGRVFGVREVQRIMGYRSPGKAKRVLERMARLGLAERDPGSGKYVLTRRLPPSLAALMVVRGRFVPKALFYSVFTTVSSTTYALLAHPPIHVLAVLLPPNLFLWLIVLDTYRFIRGVLGG